MTRLGDVFYFLRQIFLPNWVDRGDDGEPTGLQKLLSTGFLYLSSRNGTGVLFSVILHAFILAILALIMVPKMSGYGRIDILNVNINVPGMNRPEIIAPPGGANENSEPQNVIQENAAATSDTPTPIDSPPLSVTKTHSDNENAADVSEETHLQIQAKGGFHPGGGFQNRTPGGRQGMIGNGGACQGGEDAIEAALKWLAFHQNKDDGGWSFNFDHSCSRCSHSGTGSIDRRAAATALALLAFLGAGYTHQIESPYKVNVEQGLSFLVKNPNGGIDGAIIKNDGLRMYSHGLATIALCEAYAMNRRQDPKSELGAKAQESLWKIELAQTDYGGWNYKPDQTKRDDGGIGGDTSIFSWQLMALKSGQIGGLHVSQAVLYAAQDFLDTVAQDGGRRYQYTFGGNPDIGIDSPNTCTAIGLLARMYLGWKPGDVFLDDGIEQIIRRGPILREGNVNLYYIYHATLALHHYGGEGWNDWNTGIRELLIQSQIRQGCESGSWYFSDHYCDSGGRLLNTALAVMILETPYRVMPLYRKIR